MLNQSHLFVKQLRGEAHKVRYSINEREHNIGFCLSSDIFVKFIGEPQSDKHKLFA
jgi:hypothetical protein